MLIGNTEMEGTLLLQGQSLFSIIMYNLISFDNVCYCKQTAMWPSIHFSLQFGCLWASLPNLPKEPSSLAASILNSHKERVTEKGKAFADWIFSIQLCNYYSCSPRDLMLCFFLNVRWVSGQAVNVNVYSKQTMLWCECVTTGQWNVLLKTQSSGRIS